MVADLKKGSLLRSLPQFVEFRVLIICKLFVIHYYLTTRIFGELQYDRFMALLSFNVTLPMLLHNIINA